MTNILKYIVIFFFYSAAGWALESTYCSIGEKRIINRGFLTGPMCPIYGTGALVMTVFLYNPFQDRPILIFLLGMILCDIVEFLTSLIMEALFHARWWDYTYEFLNIKGRICLKHTLYWGIASVGFVYVLHPGIDKILTKLDEKTMIIVTTIILFIFTVDVINSVRKALDIRQLQLKLAKATESVSAVLSTMKSSIEGTYDSFQDTLDKGNDKINDITSDFFIQIEDLFDQFELRFKKQTKTYKNKYSNRFFYNKLSIEKSTKSALEKLRSVTEEIKSIFFENGEK
ncbi:MAG: putative ABC transporter permease [Clostridia bacterium]|nr:putative ABC transporter permease [Clostridia bacterium]